MFLYLLNILCCQQRK